MSVKVLEEKCKLFEFCNCKTAMCKICPPDESCYYYRYFKKLIEENKEGSNE